MTDLNSLLADVAQAAAGDRQPTDTADAAALLKHGAAARLHVWDRHYATPAERIRLAETLLASPPDFQAAVDATERALADELADSAARRARIRAENPHLFKDYK